jgi:hypothetical protein
MLNIDEMLGGRLFSLLGFGLADLEIDQASSGGFLPPLDGKVLANT